MAEEILLRLKLPNAVVKDVSHLIAHHMFNYQEEWSDAAVRRLIARVGEEKHRRHHRPAPGGPDRDVPGERAGISRKGSRVSPTACRRCLRQGARSPCASWRWTATTSWSAWAFRPGPQVGIILEELLQAVLEDPALNEKEKLLEIAEKLYRRATGEVISRGGSRSRLPLRGPLRRRRPRATGRAARSAVVPRAGFSATCMPS